MYTNFGSRARRFVPNSRTNRPQFLSHPSSAFVSDSWHLNPVAITTSIVGPRIVMRTMLNEGMSLPLNNKRIFCTYHIFTRHSGINEQSQCYRPTRPNKLPSGTRPNVIILIGVTSFCTPDSVHIERHDALTPYLNHWARSFYTTSCAGISSFTTGPQNTASTFKASPWDANRRFTPIHPPFQHGRHH